MADIQLFDPDAGKYVGRLARPDAGPAALLEGAMAFTPDGRFLVVTPGPGGGTGVHVWDVEKRERVAVLDGHRQPPFGVAMLPGGRCATADNDVAVRVWAVPPEPFPAVLGSVGDPGVGEVVATALALTPDGSRLVAGGAEGHVALWDTATGARLWHTRPATHEVTQVAVGPDGGLVGVAPGHEFSRSGRGARTIQENRDGLLLDAATGAVKFRLPPDAAQFSTVTGIAFRPAGGRVLTAFHGHTVREWDTADGRLVADHDVWPGSGPRGGAAFCAAGVACRPDGREFAVACLYNSDSHVRSADGAAVTARLWAGRKGGEAAWLGFGPDGRLLVGHDHTSLRAWERGGAGWRPRFALDELPRFTAVAVSPDGARLALAAVSHLIVRDARTGDELLRIPAVGCEAVAFHPDGRRLYAGLAGGVACWDVGP